MLRRIEMMKITTVSLTVVWAILFIAFTTPVQAQQGDYVLLWSYDTGKGISSVSLSSDGSYIVAGSGREVILLNREGELLWNFQTTLPVTDVSISGDGSYIVVGTLGMGLISDGWLYILNREGELLGDFETTGISSVSISPCGNYWAMAYQHGLGWWDKVILYCRVEGSWLWVYTVGRDGTGAVSVSADGEHIAVSSGAGGGEECEIRLHNKDGKLLWTYEIPGRFLGRAHSVSISADGRYIVAGDEHSDEVLLLNYKGEVLWRYRAGIIEGVSISGDGSYIVAGSRDGIYLLSGDGEVLWNHPINDLKDVSLSQDGSYIGVGRGSKVHLFVKVQIVAQHAIDDARRAIYFETGQGFMVTEGQVLLNQAGQAFEAGDYSIAKGLAEQAEARAEQIGREGRLAKSSIEEARQVISEERARGFDLVEAGSSLSQAEGAFDDREYERAVELAATAKSLALDVDRDGALNYEDFAPTINNNHIYGGAFLLVLGLISASAGVAFRRRRKKAEKEEIEGKKRAILAMIDEAVNEGRS